MKRNKNLLRADRARALQRAWDAVHWIAKATEIVLDELDWQNFIDDKYGGYRPGLYAEARAKGIRKTFTWVLKRLYPQNRIDVALYMNNPLFKMLPKTKPGGPLTHSGGYK